MSIFSIPSIGTSDDIITDVPECPFESEDENKGGELDFSERRSVRPFANSSKNGFGKSFLWTWSV